MLIKDEDQLINKCDNCYRDTQELFITETSNEYFEMLCENCLRTHEYKG